MNETNLNNETANSTKPVLAAGWIYCKDRLPEVRKRVLVTDGNIVCIAWRNWRNGLWEGHVTIDDEYLGEIIGWQDLPACS